MRVESERALMNADICYFLRFILLREVTLHVLSLRYVLQYLLYVYYIIEFARRQCLDNVSTPHRILLWRHLPLNMGWSDSKGIGSSWRFIEWKLHTFLSVRCQCGT